MLLTDLGFSVQMGLFSRVDDRHLGEVESSFVNQIELADVSGPTLVGLVVIFANG